MKYQEIANTWRKQQPEARAKFGVVLIWEDAVYGWKNELRDPDHERPGAIAVDIDGRLFRATGGNAETGAAHWEEMREVARPKRSLRLR